MIFKNFSIEDPECNLRFIRKSQAQTNPERHFHDSWELLYLSKGYRTFFHGSQTYTMTEGSLACIAPGILHRGLNRPHETCELYTIYVLDPQHPTGRTVIEMLAHWTMHYKPVIQLHQSIRYEIETMLELMGEEIIQKDPWYMQVILGQMTSLVARICRLLSKDIPNDIPETKLDYRIQKVIHFIDIQYAKPIRLEDVSELVKLSPTYFSKLFFKSTHFHFREYLAFVRVQKACTLLVKTKTPVYRIAELCGFGSVTQFGRIFLSIVGQKPLAYRKRSRLVIYDASTDLSKN